MAHRVHSCRSARRRPSCRRHALLRAVCAAAALACAALGTGCPFGPPILERTEFDSGPFFFSDGVSPALDDPVLLDFSDPTFAQAFDVEVYDWNRDDDLEYAWSYVVDDATFGVGNGVLTTTQQLGDVSVYSVPTLTVQSSSLFLREPGDEITIRLDVIDPIPEEQRFDTFADAYRIQLQWQVRGDGACP